MAVAEAAGQPLERRVVSHFFEHPKKVAAIVGGKAELGIVGHDFSQSVEHLVRHDSALMMATFWPRVGKQDKHTVDRNSWQRRNQQPRIAAKDADVFKMPARDLRQQFRYSVFEYFAAYEAGLGILLGLQREMFAPAKPDLQPSRSPEAVEQHSGIERAGCRKIHDKLRQRTRDQGPLSGTKGSTAATAVDKPTPRRLRIRAFQKARRRSSTKSNLSQEKPPSASGFRPKWP
jgi:hypothetical protein